MKGLKKLKFKPKFLSAGSGFEFVRILQIFYTAEPDPKAYKIVDLAGSRSATTDFPPSLHLMAFILVCSSEYVSQM